MQIGLKDSSITFQQALIVVSAFVECWCAIIYIDDVKSIGGRTTKTLPLRLALAVTTKLTIGTAEGKVV